MYFKFKFNSQVAENTIWLFAEKFIRLIGGLIIGTKLASYLGPSQYGQLAYATAIVSFFLATSVMGLESIVVRDLTNATDKSTLLGSTVVARLIFGLISYILFISYYILFDYEKYNSALIPIFIGLILVFQFSDSFDLYYQSIKKNNIPARLKLLSYSIVNIIRLFFIYILLNIEWFSLLILIESFLNTFFLIFYFRLNKNFNLNFSLKVLKKYLHESWPIVVSSFSIIIYMKIDQIMVMNYLGASKMGMYAAVINIMLIAQIFPQVLNQVLSPYFYQSKEISYKKYVIDMRFYTLVMGFCSLLFIAIIYIFADKIILVLYGEEFDLSVMPLKIYSLSVLPLYIGMVQSIWIINTKNHKYPLIISVISALLSYILCVLIIPTYGLLGSSWVVVICAIIANLILPILFMPDLKKLYGFSNG